ncbi:hypothetical protein MHZ95_20675 [Sporosarcina sp. ACRSM]|uniref:GyrI-like domain-containing protein n=1 Tax=Sporosarcina sp. ACRSM TaxID=2918216 RepID=UPI001EF58837|nr:GyrI-like domain-containing protein [Sporosarcina sp. ACRSM]MCG7337655.1 hypothetical protein [Sporosarcina sp. ACRSM]
MDYRIEKKESFNIVGVKKRIPIQFKGINQEIIKLAKSIIPEQREKLHSYANMAPNQIVNASYNFDSGRLEEKGSLDHMLGFLTV